MTNDEFAQELMALVTTGGFTWTTAPPFDKEPPEGSTVEGFVGNAPRTSLIATHWSCGTQEGYSAMASIADGTVVLFVHMTPEQAKVCFDIAKSICN